MRKLSAILILAILVFSILPATIAEEYTTEKTLKTRTEIKEEIKDKEDEKREEIGEKIIEKIKENGITKAEIERLRKIKTLTPVARIEKVRELNKEDFREFQKQQLNLVIDKCKENNIDPELCEKKLETRKVLIEKLEEKDLVRLKKVEDLMQELQLAILKKIGQYGEDISTISKELQSTQDSFSKLVNPIIDNKRKTSSIEEPTSKKPKSSSKSRKKKDSMNFEDFLR